MKTTLSNLLFFFLGMVLQATFEMPIEAAEPSLSLQASKVVAIDEIQFTIPDAMQFTKIASEPLIRWPVAAAWDRDGSLVVLESNWNRESVEMQLVSRPHRIVRLQDIDADGVFDKRTVIATDLSFSAGILIFENAIYVSAPPSILRLEDIDGDGIFEDRKTWHDGTTITHCANDLHGPMLGRDGWIYWTKGAFAEQALPMRDGSTLNSRAAHLLRRHPSGGGVEVMMTGGMDNPVDVAFLPDGERLFCSTFLHHPGGGVRDGIGHAVYGSLFGKPHDVLDGHRRTGPLFEPIEELGPAAPSSLTLLESPQIINASGYFEGYSDKLPVLVTTQFNFQKLSIHQLIPDGATFKTKSYDLVTADKIDFHPVDVLEDRDGNLVILDTGGWYDLCCPSSGLPGQVAPGGIYRLSASSGHSANRVLQVKPTHDVDELQRQLSDPSNNLSQRVDAFWCLAKLLVDAPDQHAVKQTVLASLTDESIVIQAAAANVVSLYRWPESMPTLVDLLKDAAPLVKRLAAECLGRIVGDDEPAIAALMNAIEQASGDRALEHAILYALIERNQPLLMRPYLNSDQPSQCWAALRVLKQLGGIEAKDASLLVQLASSANADVGAEACEILADHPEFASMSMDLFASAWTSGHKASLGALQGILRAWRNVDEVDGMITRWFGEQATSEHASHDSPQADLLLGIVAAFRGESLPEAWKQPIASWMKNADQATALRLAQAIAEVKWSLPGDQGLVDALIERSQSPEMSLESRCIFLASLPPSTVGIPNKLLDAIVSGVISEDEPSASACINAISHLQLTRESALRLIDQLADIQPTRLQPVVLSVLKLNDHELDANLRGAILVAPASKALGIDPIMTAVKNRSEESRKSWASTMEQLHAPPANIALAVDDWLAKLPGGDVGRGYQVFRNSKAACSQCHQVGYLGGKTGPELSRIGKSRMRRDLVEAILFPSARLEQSYRSTKVLTSDGRVLNGLVASKNDTTLELVCGVNERHVIRLDEIESEEPSDVSVMPSGLEQSLSLQQFADLIAYLESNR